MIFTKEEKIKSIVKYKTPTINRHPKILPKIENIKEMEMFKETIFSLHKNINILKNKLSEFYLHELSTLIPYINAQNRKAALINRTTNWIKVKKFKIEITDWGSIIVEIISSNKQEITPEKFCQKTLDEISEKYKIQISY